MRTKRGFPACTTMIVGKNATVDGSVIVAHSDDDVDDERLIYVPAADHPKGSKRPVYYDNCSLGPNEKYNSTSVRRYVGTSRGPGYDTKDYPDSRPLGEIPQAEHTYAYFDSNYGVMNEHQLMIGECTCGAKVHPEPEPGKRIFYSAELSRVALEQCKTACEAVELIGRLIAEYGYYGTGETLLLGDPGEAWVMEMCGYDMNGSDGLWVAMRVPDDEYFVAANEFRIREVEVGSDMMCSDNLVSVCEQLGWYDPSEGSMDWLPTVSWGEYSHPYYSLRRVWRALSLAKPSVSFPAWVKDGYTKAYPFSVKPDEALSVADVARIYRDHYEGTEFDTTVGPGAGPWGDPTRYEGNPDQGDSWNLNVYHPSGAWERPISIYRCGMMWINQGRRSTVIDGEEQELPDGIGGVSWVGLDRPEANCLLPFHVGGSALPEAVQIMDVTEFSRDSAWWAFNFVANYASLKYSYMMADIRSEQKQLEKAAVEKLAEVDAKALVLWERGPDQRQVRDFLARQSSEWVGKVLDAWWALSERLIVRYNDGCITSSKEIMKPVDYPESWLDSAGYYAGPTSYEKTP